MPSDGRIDGTSHFLKMPFPNPTSHEQHAANAREIERQFNAAPSVRQECMFHAPEEITGDRLVTGWYPVTVSGPLFEAQLSIDIALDEDASVKIYKRTQESASSTLLTTLSFPTGTIDKTVELDLEVKQTDRLGVSLTFDSNPTEGSGFTAILRIG